MSIAPDLRSRRSRVPGRRFTFAALLLSLFSALPGTASAQQGFAIRGGLNLSRFVGGDVDSQARRGLNLGGAMRILGAGPLGLWIEGYYRQKGAQNVDLATVATSPGSNFQVGIDYVEVPVLLRLDLPGLGSKVRPYLQGGPTFGWKIDCSVSVSAASGGTAAPDCDALLGGGLEQTLRSYEQGLVLGGGLDLNVFSGLGAVNLDARLTRGLSRLGKGDSSEGLKNQSITLMLGYAINPMALLSRR
jgi:hypothetical protein